MATYNVNGNETDDFAQAVEFLRLVQAEAKAPAVYEQHVEALQKPSALDLQRAAMGVEAPSISASSANKMLTARAEAAANAAAEAEN